MPWTYCDRINGQTITYDENGLRLSKTTGGVTTKIYRTNGQMVGMNSSDGKDLMFLLDGSGNVYGLHYDHYSSEAQTAAATYYFAYNAQGDVIGIYDASGTVVAIYAYDEWGNCTVQVLAADSNGHAADSPDHIAQVNPFRYRGYFYDGETGLYYLNSRYYDPETCRFLNVDSVIPATGNPINGYNLFAYCLNNPLIYEDAAGQFPNIIKRIVNVAKFYYNTAMAFVKAVEVNAGGGIGLGGSASASYNGVKIGVDAAIKSSDSVRVNRNGISGQHESSVRLGFSVLAYKKGIRHGVEHSYQDPNCSCNWFDSSFKEKMECPANKPIVLEVEDPKIEFGVGAYLVLGGEISVSINLREVEESLYAIFEDTMEYED